MTRSYKRTAILPVVGGLLFCILISACTRQTRFKNFPRGKTQSISFDLMDQSFDQLTDREVLDQTRDWLLYATLSGSDYSVEQINQSSYDLPPMRRDYLRPFASYEYGETRSYFIADGNVVVLVPAEKISQRPDLLAAAVDQHRKNTGEMPKAVVVFDYKINWDRQAVRLSADLTRRMTLDGAELFSKKYAYHENEIRNLADLKQFLSQVNDISHARLNGDTLIIGGRQTTHIGIGIEEIASLWQSEHEIQTKLSEVNDSLEQQIKAFEARWSAKTYLTEAEYSAALSEMRKEADQLEAQQLEKLKKTNLVSGSGFSLDPTYDFDALKNYFDGVIVNQITQKFVELPMPASNQDIKEASQKLGERNADEFLDLMDKLSIADAEFVDSVMQTVNEKFAFQSARYDGPVKGTEVGMVLFYADLMMKLWGWDYSGDAPRAIDGFRIKTEMQLSPIFEQDLKKNSNTRLWLGPRSKGFQKADGNNSLSFAPIATRLFSASSNPFKPGVEVATNAMNAEYIGWWDDHYEDVARFEPQYERLNQIMKWSLLVGWLNENGKGNQLAFLNDVQINRSHWFPDWVKQHTELKFHQYDDMFHEHGYMGIQTETMPILKSKSFSLFGRTDSFHVLSGGVSLGSRRDLKKTTALSPQTNIGNSLRRSNLDYKTSSADGVLQTVEGTSYKLTKLGDQSMSVGMSPNATAKLRSKYSELAHVNFDRSVAREGTGLNLRSRAAGVDIGDLDIARMDGGFKITWSSSDIDGGQLFARRLSSSADPAQLLSSSNDVEMYIKLRESHYLVRLRDSNRWMDISAESGANAGWDARVADIKGAVRSVELDWLDPPAVAEKLKQQGEYLVFTNEKEATVVSRLNVSSTEPVGGSETRTLSIGDLSIQGRADPNSGAITFKFSELPPSLIEEPLRLSFGWRNTARIEISKLEKGGYRINNGDAPDINAQSMPSLIDIVMSYKANGLLKNEPLLLELKGAFTPDEANGLLKNIDLRLSEFEQRPSILSILRGNQNIQSTNLKRLVSEYDFARARISEPELTVVKKGVNAGLNELKMSAEIPAKATGKQPFLLRIRMLFRTVLSNLKLSEIRIAVRRIFRRGVLEESNTDTLIIEITKELRKIDPEIRNVQAEVKDELLDFLIVHLEQERPYERRYKEDCWAI